MGTVVDKLNYLKETKTAIKNALVEKGVEVADSDTFRSYAQKVADIPAGGGDIDALIDRSMTNITSEVEVIGMYAFCECYELESVYFPFAKIISMNAFRMMNNDISKLKSASFPLVKNVYKYGLKQCDSLTSLSLPSAEVISEEALSYCKSLTSLSLPSAKSLGQRSIWQCNSLTSISLPRIESMGNYAIGNCTNLKTLYIGTESDIVCTLSTELTIPVTDIYVPEALVDSYKTATNWSKFADIIKAYTGETA